MKNILYKKENNLFQSLNWLAFQEEYGRKAVHFKDFSGIIYDLPFGKKFVWAQKAPDSITNPPAERAGFQLTTRLPDGQGTKLPPKTIFVRIEPEKVTEAEIKKLGLRRVTQRSLFAGQRSPEVTRIIDISGTEEEILAQMKAKTRYNIRLAERKGVVVKMLDSEDILYDLLKKTASRDKGYAPHEKSYYTKMVKDLGKHDVAHIFVAEHNGDFLAAILVSFFGEAATYLHGGFDSDKRNLMAPYLCQWEAIKYARERGCKYYDFWGIAKDDNPNDPWAGITRFKEGFGGEKVEYPGTYDLVISKFWYNIFNIMARVRKVFR